MAYYVVELKEEDQFEEETLKLINPKSYFEVANWEIDKLIAERKRKKTNQIEFIKDIPFLDIKKGDKFKVFVNSDGYEFIKKDKLNIYLKEREEKGYFKRL